MKATRVILIIGIFYLSVFFLSSCSGGGGSSNNGCNGISTPVKASGLLGKVFKIVDFIDIASEVYNLINTETQECECRNDYAYIVVSSDRRKGISIYIDNEFVGEANRKQAFLKVVSPGYHTIVGKDNKRNKEWEKTVSLGNGGIEMMSFNKEDWDKEDN